jgi:hypothetical protein
MSEQDTYNSVMPQTDHLGLLREAHDMLGASHTVVEGPNAGWKGQTYDENGKLTDLGYYDDDDVDDPNCKVCDLQRRIQAALDEDEAERNTDV